MREYRYTVVEHDPDRPWIVVGEIQHLSVELDEADHFAAWADQKWPGTRFAVTLDPGQEERRLKY